MEDDKIRSIDASNYLINISGETLYNLDINKILYIMDLYHLGTTGKRLLSEDFEARDNGVVLPSLYEAFKIFGADPVKGWIFSDENTSQTSSSTLEKLKNRLIEWWWKDPKYEVRNIAGTPEAEFMDVLWEKIKDYGPGQLQEKTSRAGGAWDVNYQNYFPVNSIINTLDMLDEWETKHKNSTMPKSLTEVLITPRKVLSK